MCWIWDSCPTKIGVYLWTVGDSHHQNIWKVHEVKRSQQAEDLHCCYQRSWLLAWRGWFTTPNWRFWKRFGISSEHDQETSTGWGWHYCPWRKDQGHEWTSRLTCDQWAVWLSWHWGKENIHYHQIWKNTKAGIQPPVKTFRGQHPTSVLQRYCWWRILDQGEEAIGCLWWLWKRSHWSSKLEEET